MVPYEISFETNFAHRQVAFADPFKLTEKHVEVGFATALINVRGLNLGVKH